MVEEERGEHPCWKNPSTFAVLPLLLPCFGASHREIPFRFVICRGESNEGIAEGAPKLDGRKKKNRGLKKNAYHTYANYQSTV